MPPFRERDHVSRAERFGLIQKRVFELRLARKLDEALQTLDGAREELIGVPRSLLERLDTASAAALIADATKIRVWAKVLREEAATLEEMGRDGGALRGQAAEMMVEATGRSPATEEDLAFLRESSQAAGPVYAARIARLVGGA